MGLFDRRFVVPVLLAAIYLAGLLLGAYAVCGYPIYRQRGFFSRSAEDIAREYFAGEQGALGEMTGPGTRILLYDGDGDRLLHVPPSNARDTEPGDFLERYIPAVLAGEEIFRPVLAREMRRSFSDILIITGVPVLEEGAVVAAAFIIRNLMDLPEAIMGYAAYFTVFYWLSAYFIVSNIRKNKKLEELRQNYVANVTHELKTPVSAIKALAETLCDGVEPDPDEQRICCGMILQEANRQDRMVRDMLDLSKLQSGGMDFTKTGVDPAEAFAPMLEKYTTLCDCAGISLHVAQAFSSLPVLYTNAARIKQVLGVLLDNALKFAGEGGEVWLEADISDRRATICVRDSGRGIKQEDLPRVFERFFRCGGESNESGSGLGLAIAKEIIQGLKEKIWVESEPGGGAAFFFTVRMK